jgi:hypothetical protein
MTYKVVELMPTIADLLCKFGFGKPVPPIYTMYKKYQFPTPEIANDFFSRNKNIKYSTIVCAGSACLVKVWNKKSPVDTMIYLTQQAHLLGAVKLDLLFSDYDWELIKNK